MLKKNEQREKICIAVEVAQIICVQEDKLNYVCLSR